MIRRTFAGHLLLSLFVLLAAAYPCNAEWVQDAAAKTVLTIHLGAESHPSNAILDQAIRKALQAHLTVPVNYFAEYLDSETSEVGEADRALFDYIRQRYRDRRIDLVIAVTDQPVQFALQHREELFPNVPIVCMGLTSLADGTRAAARGLTGVTISHAYGETLRVALDLHPTTERVFLIANSPNTENINAVRNALRPFEGRVDVQTLQSATVEGLLDAVKQVPPRSLILYVWHAVQNGGNLMYPDDVAALVAAASPMPVYGTSDFYLGRAVIGGVVRLTNETGTRLGEMASQILNGTRVQDVPIEAARLVPAFDWRQLQRWNISESRLPANSVVLFRTPTVWQAYRPYILGTVVLVAAQLALIASLIAQRIRRRHAEEIILRREATIRAGYERTRMLAGRLIHAQEEARAKFARDLHDGVCQELASISIALSGLKRATGQTQDRQLQRRVSTIQLQTHGLYEDIRRLSHDLHPSTLGLVGLPAALKSYCTDFQNRQGVEVQLTVDGDFSRLPADHALSLFRIAQEALRNGMVHGKARRFTVSLVNTDSSLELTVTDDGTGFDVESLRTSSNGIGIVSIEERARMFGGDAQIVSVNGEGTTVSVRTPAPEGTTPLRTSA